MVPRRTFARRWITKRPKNGNRAHATPQKSASSTDIHPKKKKKFNTIQAPNSPPGRVHPRCEHEQQEGASEVDPGRRVSVGRLAPRCPPDPHGRSTAMSLRDPGTQHLLRPPPPARPHRPPYVSLTLPPSLQTVGEKVGFGVCASIWSSHGLLCGVEHTHTHPKNQRVHAATHPRLLMNEMN